jgi:hypothetical protein
MAGGGLSLNIFNVQSKIILDEFLLDAKIRSVGVIDDSLNNEDYDYVTVLEGIASPWRQANPLKPIGYAEGVLKIADIFLVYPVDPEMQTKIKLMPRSERAIVYIGHFAVQANLTMGMDTALTGVMEAVTKRFLAITDVSVFPMFPSNVAMPEKMPVALLNRDKVQHFHAVPK